METVSDGKAPHIVKRVQSMFNTNERKNIENTWAELAEFVTATQNNTMNSDVTYSKGEAKISKRVFDSTALQANLDLASAIHATLTNPSTKWSKLRFKDDLLNNDDEAITWLETANNIVHDSLNESNFDTQVSRAYQDYPCFGNMALMHESPILDDKGDMPPHKFSAVHLGHLAWDENKDGIVDRISQKLKRNARQILQRWPDTAPEFIKQEAEQNPDESYVVYQYIWERDPKEVQLNDVGLAPGKKRPFGCLYVLDKDGTVLEETGFYEFPFYIVRWQTLPGEVIGRGPGSTALPDIRTLNKSKELFLQGMAKMINPPILAQQRDMLGPLQLKPDGISVVHDVNGIKEFKSGARVDVAQFGIEDLREAIKSIFLLDKLLLPPRTQTGEMTAFEIAERTDQMQKVLGPTLSRLNSEFLTPLVVRTFKILLRNGAFPPLPDILRQRGIDLDIIFVNQLARSQQIQEVRTMQQWIQAVAGMAQADPNVLDIINFDGAAKQFARVLGVPEIAIRSQEEVDALREQKAQAQQMQGLLEAGEQAANIANKAGLAQQLSGSGEG